jgi:hypothetical protein
MVPLTPSVLRSLLPDDQDRPDTISRVAAAWSTVTPIAHIDGESHGGTGTQAAAVWSAGRLVWGPRRTADNDADAAAGDGELVTHPADSAINGALRELGVDRGTAVDEFAAVGLDRHRHTGDWLAGNWPLRG